MRWLQVFWGMGKGKKSWGYINYGFSGIYVGHGFVHGRVTASCPGAGITSSDILTAHYVSPRHVSTMIPRRQLRAWVRTGICPVAPGVLGCGCRGEIELSTARLQPVENSFHHQTGRVINREFGSQWVLDKLEVLAYGK